MYFVHNHTSLQIRSYQPCNACCSWSITAYTTQAPTVVSCIHILMKSVFRVQLGIYKYIHVYTMYIQCTCCNVLCSQPHFTSNQVLSALRQCLPWNPVVIQVKSVYTYICIDCTVYSIVYTIPQYVHTCIYQVYTVIILYIRVYTMYMTSCH